MLPSVGALTVHSLSLLLLAIEDAAPKSTQLEPLTICFYLGIVLLIICIALLISPLRDRLAGSQRIQLGPLNLEVSVVTLLVLVSVSLIAVGFWFRLQDISNSVKLSDQARLTAEAEARQARAALERERKTNIVVFATLSGVENATKILPDLKCHYVTTADEVKDEDVLISPTDPVKRIKLTFTNIPRDSSIKRIVIENQKTHEEWVTDDDFDLFRPRIRLNK